MNNSFQKFKFDVDLIKYASSYGYMIDKNKSTKSSVAMKKANGDKIIISKRNNIWVYFSVFDDQDNGTIIDFIQIRTGKKLNEIAIDLKNWTGQDINIVGFNDICEAIYDPARINRIFTTLIPAKNNNYLKKRGISFSVQNSKRFKNTIYQDRFNNAVFPHIKNNTVCALELKNKDMNVFVRGSEKIFWQSNRLKNDTILIIAESPIDAISYDIINDIKSAFYISVSGSFSKKQILEIQNLISNSSQLNEIRIITDNDAGGDKLCLKLSKLIEQIPFTNLVNRHSPKKRRDDWNYVLQQQTSFE